MIMIMMMMVMMMRMMMLVMTIREWRWWRLCWWWCRWWRWWRCSPQAIWVNRAPLVVVLAPLCFPRQHGFRVTLVSQQIVDSVRQMQIGSTFRHSSSPFAASNIGDRSRAYKSNRQTRVQKSEQHWLYLPQKSHRHRQSDLPTHAILLSLTKIVN